MGLGLAVGISGSRYYQSTPPPLALEGIYNPLRGQYGHEEILT